MINTMSDHLVDEKDKESQPATEPQVLDDEHSLQRGIQMSLESFQAPDTSCPANSTSKADTEIFNVDEEHGQVGSNPGKTPESRPSPEHEFMEEDQAGLDPGQSHVAQAGPNPEPMHEDFIAIVYPEVHESLKLTTEE
ncbi:hypothetical protein Tco_1305771 [Tanacetum coccineum]